MNANPFFSSNLGESSGWSYKNALEKAFPDSNVTIDNQGKKTNVHAENPVRHILIKNSEELSTNNFIKILQGRYAYVHTGSFEVEISQLNNKVHQRLYLPDEISPEYRVLQSHTAPEKLVEDISNYFSAKEISKIVLKSAISHEGKGNLFADINDKTTLNQSIEKMQQLNANTKYFLAEEQKEFPHVSRKTGKEKPNHLTYRLVGIANSEGDVGHFIATKSISSRLDSHQREKMKCYFNEPGKTHHSKAGWILEACGPKDKYFSKGDNKVDIDPALMNKLSKRMYQLYADIKTMTNEEFEQHIDRLVSHKNSLGSEEKIAQFRIEEKQEDELVNTASLMAFERTMDAYPPLAAAIATEMVNTNTIDLSKLAELPYCNENYLKPFLNAMSWKKKFDGLQTANTDQLNYCIKHYTHHPQLHQTAKQLLSEKDSNNSDKQIPIDPTQEETKSFSSSHRSRLAGAFFTNYSSKQSDTASSLHKDEEGSEPHTIERLESRLAASAFFINSQDEFSPETEKDQQKLRFAEKKC